jgi:hypothetical protein
VDPTQVPAAHCVPAAQNRQAPVPLHIPSVPQVFDAVVAHWVAGVGAVPAGMLLQVPGLVESAHDLHVPVQAWLQQTPCAQKPESHSFATVHGAPVGLRVQAPPLQMLGATQSVVEVAVVQLVRQAPAVMSQVYFPHGTAVAVPQVPAPSQARGESAVVVFMHVGLPHCVPLVYL